MSTGQLALDLGHRPALDRDDFLVASSNQEAVAWLDRWPEWPSPALVIHGPAGCGKSHLASVWCNMSGALVARPGEAPVEDPPRLLERSRCWVIEGADGAAPGHEDRERALLHLYNYFCEEDGFLLFTARQAPARWRLLLPDLSSRLGAVPAVAVRRPDDALIGAVLVKLFADRQLKVGHEIVDFLLTRMERSFEAARRVVAVLDTQALARRRNITLPLVREVLHEEDARRTAR